MRPENKFPKLNTNYNSYVIIYIESNMVQINYKDGIRPMKIELIKKALRNYVISAECSNDERDDVFDALDEIAETVERYDGIELWKGDALIVPLPTIIDILNEMTYDDYGKLAKIHNGVAPFEYYAHVVRDEHCDGMAMLTDRQLRCGYDLLSDLWDDNDKDGSNNDDGTFKK